MLRMDRHFPACYSTMVRRGGWTYVLRPIYDAYQTRPTIDHQDHRTTLGNVYSFFMTTQSLYSILSVFGHRVADSADKMEVSAPSREVRGEDRAERCMYCGGGGKRRDGLGGKWRDGKEDKRRKGWRWREGTDSKRKGWLHSLFRRQYLVGPKVGKNNMRSQQR